MIRITLLLAAASAVAVPVRAQDAPSPAGAYERAATLVRDGQGAQGRRIVDSLFVRTQPGTPEHAEALYWRAALALDAEQAERDYRRLVVEYPVSQRVDRALLALAQLELARNDRERALAHLQRLEREHPAGETRAEAAFWMARIRFDMNDAPRACAALDDAHRLVAAADVELKNQIEFQTARCAGVVRFGTTASVDTAPAVDRRPSAENTSAVDRRPSAAPADTARTAPGAVQPAVPVVAADGRRRTVYAVQLAAYNTRADADALVTRLKARNIVARVSGTVKPFRVRTGSYSTRAQAVAAMRELAARGIEGFIAEEPAPRAP